MFGTVPSSIGLKPGDGGLSAMLLHSERCNTHQELLKAYFKSSKDA